MFNNLFGWFGKSKKRVAEIEAQLGQIQHMVGTLQEQNLSLLRDNEVITEKLIEYEEQEKLEEQKKTGPEPWVEVKSADYSEVRGFKIELDWNDAFVQHLKESGIKGNSDEEIVQKWLGFLYGDLIEKLERVVIDNSDKKRTNDFL
jgi:regulator of replication initiation timing